MTRDAADCADGATKLTGLASAKCAGKKRQTRRKRYLAAINPVVPWARLLSLQGASHNSLAMRELISIDIGREDAPDAARLLKFRRLQELHFLTTAT